MENSALNTLAADVRGLDVLRRAAHDNSPQALKAFAAQCGIRQPNWEFLSPPGAIVPAHFISNVTVTHESKVILAAEWGPASDGPARYLSDDGWDTFCGYFRANLDAILALRDGGPSKGAPLFLHGYAVPMPRPAPAGLGLGPWLLPSVQAYGIPEADYAAVAALLIGRLAALIGGCAADAGRYPNVHFFDTTQIPLEPAAPGSSGESGDWINEIHLNRNGCRKLAVPWSAAIEKEIVAQRG